MFYVCHHVCIDIGVMQQKFYWSVLSIDTAKYGFLETTSNLISMNSVVTSQACFYDPLPCVSRPNAQDWVDPRMMFK